MIAVPPCPAIGAIVTNRLAPEPLKTMLATGTRAGFDDAPLIVRAAALVSTSPIVIGRAGVAVPLLVVLSVVSLIVGRSLIDRTVTVTVALAAPPFPSSA